MFLIDVTKGVLTQSRRHAFISSLLGVPHLIVAVNKMDCVDYAQHAYDAVAHDFMEFASKLTLKDITFVPVSALEGDNVITRSARMGWYEGGSLLHLLETVPIGGRTNAVDLRFPVQYVIRPDQRFRGYAGATASGTLRVSDEVVVLPSAWTTRVASIETYDGPRTEALPGEPVVLTTADALDISRGDLIVRPGNLPESASQLDVYLCWMAHTELSVDRPYIMRHTTRQLQAHITRIDYVVDMATLHRQKADTLKLNDVARVEIRTGQPLLFDSYRVNAATGSFVLIDPHSNMTVAAGMVRGRVRALDDLTPRARTSPALAAGDQGIAREQWEERNRHSAAVIWLTGLPASGKTTIARALQRRLLERGCRTVLLDGDELRLQARPGPKSSHSHSRRCMTFAPAVRKIEPEVPFDPYDLRAWPVRRLDDQRAEIRYQLHTRNLELIDLLRPLARALPRLTFTLTTLCLDDSSIESYSLHGRRSVAVRFAASEVPNPASSSAG